MEKNIRARSMQNCSREIVHYTTHPPTSPPQPELESQQRVELMCGIGWRRNRSTVV